MCKCNINQNYSCDDCSRYYDLHGTFPKNSHKTSIDWTKPIRWTKKFGGGISVGYIGVAQVCVVNEHGHVYLIDKKSGQCCDVGLENLVIENIPEANPEKWVNIFWIKSRRLVEFVPHSSEAEANSCAHPKETSYAVCLGTFRVE